MVRRNRRSISACARIATLLTFCLLPSLASAQDRIDLDTLRGMLNNGKYDECIKGAAAQIGKVYGEGYYTVKMKAEMATGRYADAVQTAEAGIKKYSWSIALRWAAYDAYLHSNNTTRAADMIKEIDQLFERQSWRFSDAEDLVVLGQVALLVGADPRVILENFFDRAKKNAPNEPYGYVAAGEMALDKNDKQLAGELFGKAATRFPNNVDVLFGLARSLTDTNASRSGELFEKILKLNPKHVPTILLQTDRLISSEQFEPAEKNLKIALSVNPKSPQAWAYRAVIAHLTSDHKREAECRTKALSTWKDNPAVDHWIGAKLSRAYRFKEGAEYQRQALKFDPKYVPAQTQLSQDLLRLGQEEEGWKLAEVAHDADGYDVTTFNLLNLRDHMAKFRTIENDHFILRMSAREAGIYGERVIKLLERARTELTAKYALDLSDKITVEIFPTENDFAVRTFGMPAVSGFLGVCFGNVITANSPASQFDNPNNWESVLWHEFCHVVTLNLTRNKMPRWLSEGISVYEEVQENPAWGMEMLPQFREWIIEGEMQKVGELSKAFINAPSPMHVQFAYFQSYLVVDYIAQEHGIEAVKEILNDLGQGVLINEALNRRTNSLEELEEGFIKFAKARAESFAPDVDWSAPEATVLRDPMQLASFVTANPNNHIGLKNAGAQLIQDKRWVEAETTLKHLIEIFPQDVGNDNARQMLAKVYRETDRIDEEQKILEEHVAIASDSVTAYQRLIELYAAQKNDAGVMAMTDKLFAVNPLMKSPWKLRAMAAEATNKPDAAIEAWRALVTLQPEDPALVHYRLGALLHAKGDPEAKRHVLMALEEAPRYRDAHRLLLEIVSGVQPTPDETDEKSEKESATEQKQGSKS